MLPPSVSTAEFHYYLRRRLVQLHLQAEHRFDGEKSWPAANAERLLLCVALVFETTARTVFHSKKADGAALGGASALHERL